MLVKDTLLIAQAVHTYNRGTFTEHLNSMSLGQVQTLHEALGGAAGQLDSAIRGGLESDDNQMLDVLNTISREAKLRWDSVVNGKNSSF